MRSNKAVHAWELWKHADLTASAWCRIKMTTFTICKQWHMKLILQTTWKIVHGLSRDYTSWLENRVLAACGHKNWWPATVQAPVSFFLIILSSLLAWSSGTHSRLMIQLWCVYQMSLWASVKQSICSFGAFNEVDFDFMDDFQSRSVRTDFADIGILTDFVVDDGLCFYWYRDVVLFWAFPFICLTITCWHDNLE